MEDMQKCFGVYFMSSLKLRVYHMSVKRPPPTSIHCDLKAKSELCYKHFFFPSVKLTASERWSVIPDKILSNMIFVFRLRVWWSWQPRCPGWVFSEEMHMSDYISNVDVWIMNAGPQGCAVFFVLKMIVCRYLGRNKTRCFILFFPQSVKGSHLCLWIAVLFTQGTSSLLPNSIYTTWTIIDDSNFLLPSHVKSSPINLNT